MNYQLELDKIIENLDYKPRLLLHSCCGPCSSYCISYLAKYFEVTVFFYNPNIHPKEEYEKRLKTQKKLIKEMGLASLEVGEYDSERFFERVKGFEEEKEGGKRCALCFEMRLKKTKELAEKNNFDFFCSTLTVSPHKDAEVINSIGFSLGGEKWLFSDFKKREGYKKSIALSKEYDLYRQDYCGCIYSINETQIKNILIEKLKTISNDGDFILGVISNSKNKNDRITLIDYINSGEDVSYENLILLSLKLDNDRLLKENC